MFKIKSIHYLYVRIFFIKAQTHLDSISKALNNKIDILTLDEGIKIPIKKHLLSVSQFDDEMIPPKKSRIISVNDLSGDESNLSNTLSTSDSEECFSSENEDISLKKKSNIDTKVIQSTSLNYNSTEKNVSQI